MQFISTSLLLRSAVFIRQVYLQAIQVYMYECITYIQHINGGGEGKCILFTSYKRQIRWGLVYSYSWVCIRAGVCNVWQDDNGATMQYFAIYCDTVSTRCCLF